jgi:hypothetical protein
MRLVHRDAARRVLDKGATDRRRVPVIDQGVVRAASFAALIGSAEPPRRRRPALFAMARFAGTTLPNNVRATRPSKSEP